jgi:hypothetical protein
VNNFPSRPTRCCLKIILPPGILILIKKPIRIKTGKRKNKPVREKSLSNKSLRITSIFKNDTDKPF